MFLLQNAEIRLKYKAKKKTQQVITFVVVATPILSFSHRRKLATVNERYSVMRTISRPRFLVLVQPYLLTVVSYLKFPNGGSTAARPFVTRSFLSRFEKDHFHPHNVTPDRPCTAFFTLEDTTVTSKQIFDSLIRDGFPASAVRCLQRAANGTVHISFSNSDFRDLFVSKSSFIVANRTTDPHPARAKLVFVTVYDAPGVSQCLQWHAPLPYGYNFPYPLLSPLREVPPPCPV